MFAIEIPGLEVQKDRGGEKNKEKETQINSRFKSRSSVFLYGMVSMSSLIDQRGSVGQSMIFFPVCSSYVLTRQVKETPAE